MNQLFINILRSHHLNKNKTPIDSLNSEEGLDLKIKDKYH